VANGANIDTSTTGTKTFTVTATDLSGNTATGTATYTVVPYPFNGFFQPVDNPPSLNAMTAGQAVPVKFSLSGNRGLSIFAAGSPSSQQIGCSASAPVDPVETTVTASNSGLTYDATSDQYTYVWKTDKSWSGTCRQLNVKLVDGTIHTALFKFK
jgi:hypothetical protein